MEKVYPKTWEEYCEIDHRNPLAIETQMPFIGRLKRYGDNVTEHYYSPAFEALAKLIELRDYYNGNWVPDWNDTETFKFVIQRGYCNIWHMKAAAVTYPCVLAFRTAYLRDKFYDNFQELIEQAKELL